MLTFMRVGLATAAVLAGAWGALFLWYRVPAGTAAAGTAAAVWAALGLAAVLCAATSRWLPLALFGVAFAGLVAWYAAIEPRGDRDWAADVARSVTAEIGPDTVVVHDVRNFDWQTETTFTARWETRRYALADLRSVDLINSYWAGPHIAHTLLSFGFADGRQLAFSVEIRRERDEVYSNLAGFFKQYELVVIAADERDIVRLRSNVRREDVRVFRLKVSPDQARRALVELLERANRIAAKPALYHSLKTNCTTELFGTARAIAPGLPFDWRIILSGYLPDYAYDHGLLDSRLDLPTLRERGAVSERALAADTAADFSQRIRVGLPDPNA